MLQLKLTLAGKSMGVNIGNIAVMFICQMDIKFTPYMW